MAFLRSSTCHPCRGSKHHCSLAKLFFRFHRSRLNVSEGNLEFEELTKKQAIAGMTTSRSSAGGALSLSKMSSRHSLKVNFVFCFFIYNQSVSRLKIFLYFCKFRQTSILKSLPVHSTNLGIWLN